MNRRILKTVMRVLVYVLVIAVAASVLRYASVKNTSDEVTEHNKIYFLASELEEGEQIIAENTGFILSADMSKNTIRLTDKRSQKSYLSAAEGIDARDDLKKAVVMELSSLLYIKYADRDSNVTSQNSVAGALNKNDVSAELIKNGVRFEYYFSTEGFLIPLEIVLTDSGIKATVPLADIQEESSDIKLTSISVLPNFGSALQGSQGYMLVPDGSGAVISYDICSSGYSQRIYGDDPAVSSNTSNGNTAQTARLPVFGASYNGNAFIGIITSGDTRANVNAVPPTAKSPYGSVYTEFIYREKIVVDISQQTFESTQANLFEPNVCSLDRFTVEYRLPEGNDYVSMANTYRDYLINTVGMTPLSESVGALQLQLIGGVMHSENFLGVPVNRVLPITTYDDAVSMVEELKDMGTQRVIINYLYWYNNATDRRLTLGIDTESRLGNKKSLDNMVSEISKNGKVYLDLNFTELYSSHKGFSAGYDSARTVLLEPLAVYKYQLSTYQKDSEAEPLYLLNTDMIKKAAQKLLKKSDAEKYSYSLNSMGSMIYSDFGEKAGDRGAMRSVFTDVMQSVSDVSDKLMFDGANAYAFPYAGVIQGVPTESSSFLCEDASVPFYAIALHGLVQMGTAPVNAENSRQTVLKAIESGIAPTYVLGKRNTNMFKNTAISDYSYIDSDYWLSRAAEAYSEVKECLLSVENRKITSHDMLSNGVYKTGFDNGCRVIVNYNDTAVMVEGITVEAQDFVFLK